MADTMPSTTPDANGCRRWARTMASRRKATTGMSSPPVASGSDAMGKIDQRLDGADLATSVRSTEIQRERGHHDGRQAEEDARVAEPVVAPDVARDAEHRHERQVGQEAGVVGLTRRVVLHLVGRAVDLEVGVLPLDQVLPADFDHGHLGLLVRAGHPVEAPHDLEAHAGWRGRRRTRRRPRRCVPARPGGAAPRSAGATAGDGGPGAPTRRCPPTRERRTRREPAPSDPTPGTARWSTCRSCRARRARWRSTRARRPPRARSGTRGPTPAAPRPGCACPSP